MAARQRSLTSVDREIGAELAQWGKVALLETVGRVTGAPVTAAVGFVEGDGPVLFMAAGSEMSDWALNLRANSMCRVTIGDRASSYTAAELDEGNERSRALTGLILKYGTPAERLGRGPVFRLSRNAENEPRLTSEA